MCHYLLFFKWNISNYHATKRYKMSKNEISIIEIIVDRPKIIRKRVKNEWVIRRKTSPRTSQNNDGQREKINNICLKYRNNIFKYCSVMNDAYIWTQHIHIYTHCNKLNLRTKIWNELEFKPLNLYWIGTGLVAFGLKLKHL